MPRFEVLQLRRMDGGRDDMDAKYDIATVMLNEPELFPDSYLEAEVPVRNGSVRIGETLHIEIHATGERVPPSD